MEIQEMQGKNSENDMENRIYELKLNGCYYGNNCFPSLNNLISEAERHYQSYNRLKKQLEMVVINAVRTQLKGYKATRQVQLHFIFGERQKGVKRDYDNVLAAASKIICDALVKSGVLKDDAPAYLLPSTCEFHYVEKPFIHIQIREAET
jgi:Holliday junction resolvase RusA-like endonuclease